MEKLVPPAAFHESLNKAYTPFIDSIIHDVNDRGIETQGLFMDHVGYQAASEADYNLLSSKFNTIGNKLSEVLVHGRRVGIYQLHAPLAHKDFSSTMVEIYEPTKDQVCANGFEHVEFVIPLHLDSFMQMYPALSWNTSSINDPNFPQLKLSLTEHTQVKFHTKSILEILNQTHTGERAI